MNKLTIIGNLTRDPELRTTSTGVNTSVQVTDTTAVSGKGYSYCVRCMSKDKKVPLSSYKNTLMITYKKP